MPGSEKQPDNRDTGAARMSNKSLSSIAFFIAFISFLLNVLSLSLIMPLPVTAAPKTVNQLARVKRYGFKDGFPHQMVTSMLQDSRGFMWFGTPLALYRFDGYNFKSYNPTDSKNFSQRGIVSMYEDREGSIWMGTMYGLMQFDTATETFTPRDISTPGTTKMTGADIVMYFCESPSDPDTLWLATFNKFIQFDKKQKKVTWWKPLKKNVSSIMTPQIFNLYADREGNVLASTIDGLQKFDRQKQAFTPYPIQFPGGKRPKRMCRPRFCHP